MFKEYVMMAQRRVLLGKKGWEVNPVYRCVVPVPLTVKLFISESDGEMGTENEDFCDAEYYFRIFDMC